MTERKRCPRCGSADYVSYWSVKKHQADNYTSLGKRMELLTMSAIYPNAMLCVDCELTCPES
jgi:hypothetical protein